MESIQNNIYLLVGSAEQPDYGDTGDSGKCEKCLYFGSGLTI